jgi:hypothetical protein
VSAAATDRLLPAISAPLKYYETQGRRTATFAPKSDRDAICLLKAQAELRLLSVIFEHLDDLSPLAQDRIAFALKLIDTVLERQRPALGLPLTADIS